MFSPTRFLKLWAKRSHSRKFFSSCVFLLLGLAAALGCEQAIQAGQSLSLGLPIACTLGRDCFILLYPDRDPGPGAVDFGCGRMTYDSHQGTDFAIPDRQVMVQGVAVQAVAAGKVLRSRDGVPDRPIAAPSEKPEVKGIECGNGIIINHGYGWETQYCHLRQNSVAVKPGDFVSKGTILGLVGIKLTKLPELLPEDLTDLESHLCLSRAGARRVYPGAASRSLPVLREKRGSQKLNQADSNPKRRPQANSPTLKTIPARTPRLRRNAPARKNATRQWN